MKKGMKASASALLALILSVSVGISVGWSNGTTADEQQKNTIADHAGIGSQSMDVRYQDAKKLGDRKVSVNYAAPVQMEQEAQKKEQTVAAEESVNSESAAGESAGDRTNAKIIGKTNAELYPDYVASGYDLSQIGENEGTVIATQDDYFELVSPSSNGEETECSVVLPSAVDNSTSEYFPEIDSQGRLGSCTTWSTIYYQMTYTYNRSRGIKTTHENRLSPEFTFNALAYGNINGNTSDTESYAIANKYGCFTWEEFPYNDVDVKALPVGAEAYKKAATRKLKAYQVFKNVGGADSLITSPDDSDLDAIKTALSNEEILAIGVSITTWRYDRLKSADDPAINQGVVGEQVVLNCERSPEGHAMTIVGYNDNIWTDLNGNDRVDAGEMGAFKIANSWGLNYGNKGFIWMAYDALNNKSCVTGAYNSPNRDSGVYSIYRIEVMPPEKNPHRFIEYTINTDDRYHTGLQLSASWTNKTVTTAINVCGGLGDSYLAFDGSIGAKDAEIAFDLDYLMDKLHATDISEVDWQLTVNSKESTGHALTLKSCTIYDEEKGYRFEPSGTLPLTVLNNKQTIRMNVPTGNNAIIYYRGFDEPSVRYSLGSSSFQKELPMWYEDQEYPGYVYKCVIPLGQYSSASVWVGGQNSIWDDNGGKSFIVKKGDNFIVTEGVGEPLTFSVSHSMPDGADLGTMDTYRIIPSGGYPQYKYRIVIKDKKTGELERNDENYKTIEKTQNYLDLDDKPNRYLVPGTVYTYQKATSYEITVYLMDATGVVVSQKMETFLIDEPMRFEELKILNEKPVYNCNEELQLYCRTVNDQSNGGNCNCHLGIMRGNKLVYSENPRMSHYGSNSSKTANHTYHWTPTEGGDYTAIVSRTDANKDYAFKILKFTVAPSDVALSQASFSCEDMVPMGEKVRVTAKASGGNGVYQYQYSYIRYGKETVVSPYSSNSSGEIQLPCDGGAFELVVTVKDGNGMTASRSKTVWTVQPRIKKITADVAEIQAQDTVKLSPEVQNAAEAFTSANYVYTASLNGQEAAITTNADKTGSWKPAQAGTYTVRLAIKNGDTVMAVKSCQFTVAERTKPLENKIRIGVVYYIHDAYSPSQFKLHYWNNNMSGDVACVSTGATANVSVGSAYWSGAAQQFYLYEASVPPTATGYKFHIGDRWFGADGNVAAGNAVYIFEYGGSDNAMYRKE